MFKNEKGFTLMETIISIATIAIISGFILQMFIVSSNVNKKAKDLDMANLNSMNAIEMFKSQDRPEDFLNESLIASSLVKENNSGMNIYVCYDKDWQQVGAPEGVDLYPTEKQSLDVQYVLQMDITSAGGNGFDSFIESAQKVGVTDGAGTGQLYTIHVAVKNYKNPLDKQEILNLSTTKYFSN